MKRKHQPGAQEWSAVTFTRERLTELAEMPYEPASPGKWLLSRREVNELARLALIGIVHDSKNGNKHTS